jgi:type 1 glutamine amidotransferase
MQTLKNTLPLAALLLSGMALNAPHARAAEPAAKRVLVVTVTTGFRHSSIPTAERILQKIADDSKAFTIVGLVQQPATVVPRKPSPPRALPPNADDNAKKRFEADTKRYEEALAKWTPEVDAQAKAAQQKFNDEAAANLARLAPAALDADKIDGVIFANTTGDLPLPDKEGFIKWVENGHSLMAMHSASDTLHGFRPYIEMLGGEFETHGGQAAVDLTALDPAHPATAGIPSPWPIAKEEMYHIKSYDRSRVHDIFASPVVPMDGKPEQGQAKHFPVSWVRTQGTGRVFYTSLGHREDVWDDDANLPNRLNPPEVAQRYQKHILGGIRWALGLAEGSSAPSAPSK